MTRDEFIKMLKANLKPNAEMNFLVIGRLNDGKFINAFLDIHDICMNVDVDDPKNKNCGGVIFNIQEDLSI